MLLKAEFRQDLSQKIEARWDLSFVPADAGLEYAAQDTQQEREEQDVLLGRNWNKINDLSEFNSYIYVRAGLPEHSRWECDKRIAVAALRLFDFQAMAVGAIFEGLRSRKSAALQELRNDTYLQKMKIEDVALMISWVSVSREYFSENFASTGEVYDPVDEEVTHAMLARVYAIRQAEIWDVSPEANG